MLSDEVQFLVIYLLIHHCSLVVSPKAKLEVTQMWLQTY